MKVLIVNRYMNVYGGAEQVVAKLSNALKKIGVDNLILALNKSPFIEKEAGTSIISPTTHFEYKYRSASFISSLGIIKEIVALRRLLLKYCEYFDVINVHNFPANWIVYNIRKPVVWTCNEVPDFYHNPQPSAFIKVLRNMGIKIDRYMVNNFIDIICVADKLNEKAVFNRYKRDAYIVNYGIDHPQFVCTDEEEEKAFKKYNLKKEDFIILQVGVISPTKNQKDALRAVNNLRKEISNLKLILAGDDKTLYAKELKEFIKNTGLEGKIIFTGFLSKEEVYKLYSVCNMCVFPVKFQGGYLSVIEAISARIPVVVYPTMGVSYLVKEKNLGIVSPDLEESIRKIYNNYSYYKQQAQAASAWVRENISWQKFAEKMVEIFKKAKQGEKL